MHKTKNRNAFMNSASKYQSGQANYEASRTCFTGSVCRERVNYVMKILINKYNLTSVKQLCYIFQSLSLYILTANVIFCQSSFKGHFKFLVYS